ncbi:hypothetical protein KSP40_PGU015522 [Platanthera guangdongensis]|uniref:Homeobox domain-containing protein n=1 Tax=Platanthera guangdongensis TaxID=2320717 RepID=A0ABR2LWC8_9ASPA
MKKLYDAFQENQYPTKEKKECLAQELGMTFQQKLNEAFQENQFPSKGKKEELAQELGMTSRQVW